MTTGPRRADLQRERCAALVPVNLVAARAVARRPAGRGAELRCGARGPLRQISSSPTPKSSRAGLRSSLLEECLFDPARQSEGLEVLPLSDTPNQGNTNVP